MVLAGRYQKWNSNGMCPEFVITDDTLPASFSHFSYTDSTGQELICDLQGVELSTCFRSTYLLTDPQIHTPTPNQTYGVGNMGQEGIANFFTGHSCSKHCQKMRLLHPNPRAPVQLRKQMPDQTTTSFGIIVLSIVFLCLASVLSTAWNFAAVMIAENRILHTAAQRG